MMRRRILFAIAPVPLIVVGYFAGGQARVAHQLALAEQGRHSTLVRAEFAPGHANLPIVFSSDAAKLFNKGKGHRVDRYDEIVRTSEIGRDARVVMAAFTPNVDITGSLPRSMEREVPATKGKSGLLHTQAVFGNPDAASFLSTIWASLKEAEKPKVETPPSDPLALKDMPKLPRSMSYMGETEAEYQERQRRCLATAIYFEARGEPLHGQIAVAQVVMNRMRSPDYPDTICGVVYQGQHQRTGCQFSFTCDGIADVPKDQDKWAQAMDIAKKVTDGKLWLEDIGHATHYHATYVTPQWVRAMNKIEKIGQHIFYRLRAEKPYDVDEPPADGGSDAPSGTPETGLALGRSG